MKRAFVQKRLWSTKRAQLRMRCSNARQSHRQIAQYSSKAATSSIFDHVELTASNTDPPERESSKQQPDIKDLTLSDVLAPDNILQDMIRRMKLTTSMDELKSVAALLLEKRIKEKQSMTALLPEFKTVLNSPEKIAELRAFAAASLRSPIGLLALDLYTLGETLGDDEAAYRRADLLTRGGRGIPARPDLALSIMSRLASKGHVRSLIALGVTADNAGQTERATQLFKSAAEKGSSDAYYLLGRMTGNIECFQRAAELGNAHAHFYLAKEETHPERQLHHLQEAARSGSIPDAAHNLAIFHEDRDDFSSAREWYTVAGEQNFPPSMMNLAKLLEDDRGGIEDTAGAVVLYRRVIGLLESGAFVSPEMLEKATEAVHRLEVQSRHDSGSKTCSIM